MKLWRIAAGLAFMVAGNLAAWGQEATPATAANAPPATKAADALAGMAGTGKITLKEGTDVSLKFAQDCRGGRSGQLGAGRGLEG